MKKLFSITFIVLMLVIMMPSCNKNSDNLDDVSSTSESSTIKEDSIIGFSITSEELEKTYMTKEEIEDKILSKNFYNIGKYIVLHNLEERVYVVMCVEKNTACNVQAYEMVTTRPEETEISVGMSIYDVVRIAGAPANKIMENEWVFRAKPTALGITFNEDGFVENIEKLWSKPENEETSTATGNAPSDKPNLSAHELMKLYDELCCDFEGKKEYYEFLDFALGKTIDGVEPVKNDHGPITFAKYKIVKSYDELEALKLGLEIDEQVFSSNYVLAIERAYSGGATDMVGYRELDIVAGEPVIVLDVCFGLFTDACERTIMIDCIAIPKEKAMEFFDSGEILILECVVTSY